MTYEFKLIPELLWAIALGALAVLVTAFAGDPPTNVSDWIVVTVWGLGRAVVGAALNVIRMYVGARTEPPQP